MSRTADSISGGAASAETGVRPIRRHEEDLERVRRYLDEGGLREQDRLPPERELAVDLGLTRSRVRNALRKLAAQGLIWRHVGKGTFIGPVPVLSASGKHAGVLFDLTNPREILEARLALEPELARLASLRGTRKDFAEVEYCLEQFRAAGNGPSWELWDTRLHRAIASAAENKVMLALFDLISSNRNKEIWGNLRSVFLAPERMREIEREHTKFVEAILSRNPDEAYGHMRNHILSVTRVIFREA